MRTLHFGLRVADLDRSLAFYNAVGYEVVGSAPKDPVGHLTMLKLRRDHQRRPPPGLDHSGADQARHHPGIPAQSMPDRGCRPSGLPYGLGSWGPADASPVRKELPGSRYSVGASQASSSRALNKLRRGGRHQKPGGGKMVQPIGLLA